MYCNNPEKAKEPLVKIEPSAAALFSDALVPSETVKPVSMKGACLPIPLKRIPRDCGWQKSSCASTSGVFVTSFDHETSGRPVFEILDKQLKAFSTIFIK